MNRDHLERTEALRRARQGAVPEAGGRVTAGDIGACALILLLIAVGLPACAILFSIGGGQ